MGIKLEYSSNNSGGGWWLKDEDWKNLEAAGWDVEWEKDKEGEFFNADEDGRWLGALARAASKEFPDPDTGIQEWERITGQRAADEGCNCCGQPHNFSWTDEKGKSHYASVEVLETRLTW